MVKKGKLYRETFTAPMYWAVKHGNLPAVRALLKSWNVNWIIDRYDEEGVLELCITPLIRRLIRSLIRRL